jgi:tetratricopeptide (TPR) repeat protein
MGVSGFGQKRESPQALLRANRFFDKALQSLASGSEDLAVQHLRAGLADFPGHLNCLNELGAIALTSGDDAAALMWFEKALVVASQSEKAKILNNLASCWILLGEPQKACALLNEALAVQNSLDDSCLDRNGTALVVGNLARIAQQSGDLQAALESGRESLGFNPDDHNIRWLVANVLLAMGRQSEAWPLFESRLFADNAVSLFAYPDLPLWSPADESCPDCLLIVGEQGLGDCLMWMRFLPLLRSMCRGLEFCGPPSLRSIFESLHLVDRYLTPDQITSSGAQRFLPLLSLGLAVPNLFDHAAVCLGHLAYKPPPLKVQEWTLRLPTSPRPLLVGLHWQGNPQAEERSLLTGRSIPLAALRPLQQLPNCQWVSLQYGAGEEQITAADRRQWFVPWQDQVDQAPSLEDRAALLRACDLLVTTDSMVAHLAGLVGTPTLLLLHHCPEWRWHEGACPGLYPTHTILRQRSAGDWQPVVADAAARIGHWPRRA